VRVDDLGTFPSLRDVLNRSNVAYVATYPPAQCGIATFTSDLLAATERFTPFCEPQVVAVEEEGQAHRYDPHRVKITIAKQEKARYQEAADYINRESIDVVSVQHEFGIFGGSEGEHLIDFLAALAKPVVTTLHTVVSRPWGTMREGMEAVFRYSDTVVVMLDSARNILSSVYGVDTSRVRTIPHGVPAVPRLSMAAAKKRLGLEDRRVVSTFGLVSRSKGLEFALQAMPAVVQQFPDALYLVLGETHPSVRRREGEVYRDELEALVRRLGLGSHVRFVNRYLSIDELTTFLSASDVYVTPYVNPDQIVSGTLAYAVGRGCAVVSTPYLYAQSVLSENRGLLANFGDPESIAAGIARVLGDDELRDTLAANSYRWGRRTAWPNVALQYLDVFRCAMDELRIAA
jgi:glycosyltransferase involved in cell wall biosynthesis